MINWSKIFSNNKTAVVDYVAGHLTFRDFERSLSGDAKKEVKKLSWRNPDYRRTLARKAVRRRSTVSTI